MSEDAADQGIIQALVDRLEQHRLPIALQLRDKVNSGQPLNELDIAFLEKVFAETGKIKPMLDRYPEWQPLAARMIGLYNEITTKALQNETGAADDD